MKNFYCFIDGTQLNNAGLGAEVCPTCGTYYTATYNRDGFQVTPCEKLSLNQVKALQKEHGGE